MEAKLIDSNAHSEAESRGGEAVEKRVNGR
jgi:hypothetical protein